MAISAPSTQAPPSTPALTVGVLAETEPREHRVALDPDAVVRLRKESRVVLVETGAGSAASFPDSAYVAAGADVIDRAAILQRCDVLAVVQPPTLETVALLRRGQVLIGMLDPLNNHDLVSALLRQGVTAAAFELLPRTLSRAQSMDALSSQASAAGYRAAIVAAESFGRYLPMMITASGTARPATVMVIGAGVAGLQAIGTARRLGAVVTGYDVRPSSRGEVESLGAQFATSSVAQDAAAGGYARPMTEAEQTTQQTELAEKLRSFDIIITTAKVPGHTPPLLVSTETLATLKPGSVCIDLAAIDRGGNVAGSVNGERIVTDSGVIVIGGGDLASDLPASASQMYARNVSALLDSLLVDGVVTIDPADEVQGSVVVCHDGAMVSAAVEATSTTEHPTTDHSTSDPSATTTRPARDSEMQHA